METVDTDMNDPERSRKRKRQRVTATNAILQNQEFRHSSTNIVDDESQGKNVV